MDQAAIDHLEATVSGLKIYRDFISKEEEEAIINAINEKDWDTDLKRKVQQYGYKFNHKAHSIKGGHMGPLPDFCKDVTARLVTSGIYSKYSPDQMIINHYAVGQGIFPHWDSIKDFDEVIVSIGLGSSCIMKFSNAQTNQELDVFFERRMAVVLTGEARYVWRHGIPSVTEDTFKGAVYKRKPRISLTWRKVIESKSDNTSNGQTAANINTAPEEAY